MEGPTGQGPSPCPGAGILAKPGPNSHAGRVGMSHFPARCGLIPQSAPGGEMRRVVFFVYGTLSYLVFLATFLYAIGFVGNFGVPRTLDGPLGGSLATALAVNASLLALFAVQHSVMARR